LTKSIKLGNSALNQSIGSRIDFLLNVVVRRRGARDAHDAVIIATISAFSGQQPAAFFGLFGIFGSRLTLCCGAALLCLRKTKSSNCRNPRWSVHRVHLDFVVRRRCCIAAVVRDAHDAARRRVVVFQRR
jgi:hypothetical protein